MDRRVIIRNAEKMESALLAEYTLLAGDGVFEYLLVGMVENMSPLELLSAYCQTENPTYCWRNAAIAESAGNFAGMMLSFPFRNLDFEDNFALPPDRLALIEVFNCLQCPGSYYVSAMAVHLDYRGIGVGGALLSHAVECARSAGFHRLSLHFFEQNEDAVRLYRRHGFKETGRKLLPEIFHLRRSGRVLLMERAI